MKYATKPQVQKINILLNKLGLAQQKAEIVSNFTDARTERSSLMSVEEARQLIMKLAEYDPSERLKSLIFSLAYQSGIIYGTTSDDKKINAAKLNMFLVERGAVKMELNKMSYPDLIKAHRQFEGILRNTNKGKDKKIADKLVSNLLSELDLSISTAH